MRRLYSEFARGAPGVGLLLLRLAAGAVLLVQAHAAFRPGLSPFDAAFAAISGAAGLLLILGLWTPVAGVLAVGVGVGHALAGLPGLALPVFSAVVGAALALLGPGGWSVDARLFGWRRIEIRDGHASGTASKGPPDDVTPE